MNGLAERFIQTIKNNKEPSKIIADKSEIWVRCPYCGDSQKQEDHGHFYIETSAPFRYYCQKCTEKGRVTNNTLRDLDLDDPDLFIMLAELTKEYIGSDHYTPPIKINNVDLKVFKTNLSEFNLKYMENRFNKSFDPDRLVDTYRCIIDPIEFLKEYPIEEEKRRRIYFDFSKSIGFISKDYSHITFRDTSGCAKNRFYVHALDENGSKTYFTKEPIDVMSKNINVHLTEGIFDIIGVKEKLNKESINDIYIASCGKSYLRAIRSVISQGFLNLNINFYSDQDVQPKFFSILNKNNVEIKLNNKQLFYNDISHDFGVAEEKIKFKMGVI